MPVAMLILGGIIGTIAGTLLAGGLAAVAALPVYGPAPNIFAALIALGIPGIVPQVVHPIETLFGAGLGVLVATIFFYVGAVVSGAGAGEFFSRGALIGLASSTNTVVMLAIPPLAPVAPIVFIITVLAVIPPIAANRFYQRVLGLLGWILPLNYLMLPLGILLFLVSAPFALAMGGSVRFDFLTLSIETAGGAILSLASTSFNIGNFTFFPPILPTSSFTTGFSAHETGHTLSNAAFGGFFYWIGAIDENVPPLARSAAAYSELFAESHFSTPGMGVSGGPFIPMW